MTRAPTHRAPCIRAFAACLALAGCAGSAIFDVAPQGAGAARTPDGESLAPQAAMDMIAIGKSSKSDVNSALGTAVVVAFDSGYEVWVYRWRGADKTTRAATELVVLFAPSGLATKVRMRPGYPARNPS